MKGINWNPVPKGGTHPKDLNFRGFVEADSELMHFAGINAVRTYETITDTEVLDILYRKGIYVLNTVYIYGGIPVDSLVDKVRKVRDHPAILMWVVGNEWNYNGLYVGLPFPKALAKVKEAVKLIKQHDPHHPVATIHGEMPSPQTIQELSDVDAWGINKYSGISFGNLFEMWAQASDRPIFLGEYGADAYNSKTKAVDPVSQAKAVRALTQEIIGKSSVQAGGVCIGGLVFELADEWWKDGSGNPKDHDVGGVSPGGGPYPDMTFNEEWWGLTEYDGTPREAFKAYADTPVPGGAQALALDTNACPAYASPLRMNACGAHPACKGELGDCCPGKDGVTHPCCSSTATTPAPTTEMPVVKTTWRPPEEGTSGQETTGYEEQAGKFANDPFEVGTDGCHGVGECQFMTRRDAQVFCNNHPECTIVLMHPFSGYCAGGMGCYTPRKGNVFSNSLWDRSGGKAWVKHKQVGGGQVVESTNTRTHYIFVGFHKAPEAHDVCRPYGRLAAPKTAEDRRSLQAAVDAAEAAGKLSKQWPANTIWLGGQWNSASERWEWDDGDPIVGVPWAPGQPSAHEHQDTEPWLCMVLDGHFHDSDPPYAFGVMCETDSAAGSKPPPKPTAPPTAPPAASAKPAPSGGERTTITVHDTSHGPGNDAVSSSNYWFGGFARAAAARQACGANGQLAMPKSQDEVEEVKNAINRAFADGKMDSTWPRNTIWLGGQYNVASRHWEWDDGTAVTNLHWGLGQPSGDGHQDSKPWLGMHSDGTLLDSDSPNEFGVMCELKGALPEMATQPCCTYQFVGFKTATEAPSVCKRTGGRVAMPKTYAEQQNVHHAILDAMVKGQMNKNWPKNTAWIGGQWQDSHWMWNDGTPVMEARWAQGQPSSAADQEKEPYMCMVSEGVMHDTPPQFDFAVICEYGVRHDPGVSVCMIDAPGWLRLFSVVVFAGLIVAGLRRWQGPTWSAVVSSWDTASWNSVSTSVQATYAAIMQMQWKDRIVLLPIVLVLMTFFASLMLGPCLFPLSLPAILVILGGLIAARVLQTRSDLGRCPMILDAFPSLPEMFPSALYNRGSEQMSPNRMSPITRYRGSSGV